MKTNTKKLLWLITYSTLLTAFMLTPTPWDLPILVATVFWAYKAYALIHWKRTPPLIWTRPTEYPNTTLWVAEPATGIEYAVYENGCGWRAFIEDGGFPQLVGNDRHISERAAKARCQKHWKNHLINK